MISVVGFGIAFRGIFPYVDRFSSLEKTILVLFDAALGQHDFTIFEDEPLHEFGIVLFFVYIAITMVVLLNLVIATFSVSRVNNVHILLVFLFVPKAVAGSSGII